MFEELVLDPEHVTTTANQKIFIESQGATPVDLAQITRLDYVKSLVEQTLIDAKEKTHVSLS
jgi:methylphosphotriester-DNA--protein-cysteine methyltransferase